MVNYRLEENFMCSTLFSLIFLLNKILCFMFKKFYKCEIQYIKYSKLFLKKLKYCVYIILTPLRKCVDFCFEIFKKCVFYKAKVIFLTLMCVLLPNISTDAGALSALCEPTKSLAPTMTVVLLLFVTSRVNPVG